MGKFHISIFLIVGFLMTWSLAENLKLALKNFQINFLSAMEEIMEREANIFIDELLNEFSHQKEYESFQKELKEAKEAKHLEAKIVLVKQLIDVTSPTLETDNYFYMIRNVNFFKKLKHFLQKLEEESYAELRDIRMYRICKQFKNSKEKESQLKDNFNPYSSDTKMVPFNEENIGNVLDHLNAKENHTIKIDVKEFGDKLYAQVKEEGAEIIDDYLRTVRKLVQEVIDEKTENDQHSDKLMKLLNEIDSIMNISDFFEKRQKLYKYLEVGLVDDYEQFNASEGSLKDISEVFAKLKARGLDLFVSFLFSNFQFLEHLHAEWRKLLPEAPVGLYDEQTLHLHNIHHHYKEFKKGHEVEDKYANYIKHVTTLRNQTSSDQDNMDSTHIFELLHNASLNLGTVTLNMIKQKCEEF